MQGDLTTVCLPDLLRTLYVERRTGELIFTQGQQRKQIYFELGNIVFSASNQREDRIGEVLLRHGLLSYDNFEKVLAETQNGKRFGKAMVELGIMSESDLVMNVTFQILDIIFSLFTWTVGQYQFIEGRMPVAEELKLKLTTASIILEGVRRIEDFEVIRRGLGDLNRLVSPSSSPLLRLQTISLKPVERRLVELVKSPTDLLQLLINSQAPPDMTLRSLYGLLSAGILEQTQAPQLSRRTGKFTVPEGMEDNPPAPAPVVQQTPVPAPPDFRSFMRDLEIIKARIGQNNPYITLDFPPNGTMEDLNQAYFKLAEKFHPDRFLQAPRELRLEIDAIFRHIAYAYEMLRQRLMAHLVHSMRQPVMPQPGSGTQPLSGMIPPASATQPLSGMVPPPAAPQALPGPPPATSEIEAVPTLGTGALGGGVPYPNLTQSLEVGYRLPRPVAFSPSRPAPTEISLSGTEPEAGEKTETNEDMWPASLVNRRQSFGDPGKNANIDAAIEDLMAYLDDLKAPLFVADSLSLLFKTTDPILVKKERLAEIIASWALRRASLSGKPVHEVMLAAVNNIKHAEQARVLLYFNPSLFYEDFIRELMTYCPPEERELFDIKLGGIKELLRR
ncbi:MAG: DUF4388 domain-containing protein [Blastocatellia bacterium]|nr:DUF4388 domain-containing protein [Blastocatellia bacterium]